MAFFFSLLALIPFYFLGAFPTGRLIAASKGIDLEKVGSGNVGATNVSRALGKKAGLLTLLFDMGKGALAVLLAGLLSEHLLFVALAGLAVVSGHCFSLPGKWKGGKGVATAFGSYLAFEPMSAGLALGVFLIVFSIWRYVSLASVAAALAAPFAILFSAEIQSTFLVFCAISILVVWRHKDNLHRLVEGRETKFSANKIPG